MASQRLKGSLSARASSASASASRLTSRMTGAAKPRLRLGTGFSRRPEKTQVWRASLSSNMRVSWAEPSDSPLSRTGISRPSASSSATGKGMSIGSLAGWPGVDGVVCSTVMTSWARLGVPLRGDGDARGACLRVPAAELLEVATRGLLHGFEEGLARHGVAVVAGDVEVETLAEGVLAQKRLEHADDFGALFIHGARVEVVDLLIAVGTDRVGHGACVLGELGQT